MSIKSGPQLAVGLILSVGALVYPTWVGQAGQAIAQEIRRNPAQKPLRVWRTIKLGSFESLEELRNALTEGGYSLGSTAKEMLKHPEHVLDMKRTEIDLVIVSPAELGFQTPVTLTVLYARAVERGLALCPPEAGPQLRLQHKWQRIGEFLDIAMEPIPGWNDRPSVFSVRNGGAGMSLTGRDADPESKVAPESQFVFVRPRQVIANTPK